MRFQLQAVETQDRHLSSAHECLNGQVRGGARPMGIDPLLQTVRHEHTYDTRPFTAGVERLGVYTFTLRRNV